MSGAKSYSVEVFDNHLKHLFMLQCEMEELWKTVKSGKIFDKKRNVKISNQEFIKKNRALFKQLANPFFELTGEKFNQSQFDDFYNRIHLFTDRQEQLIKAINNQLKVFGQIETAYSRYLEMEELNTKYNDDLKVLKYQLISYLKSLRIEKQLINNKVKEIEETRFDYHLPPFDEKMAENIEAETQKMAGIFIDSKNMLGVIAGTKTIAQPTEKQNIKVKLVSQSRTSAIHVQSGKTMDDYSLKISDLIPQIKTKKLSTDFSERLLVIRKNTKPESLYFFIELHEEIKHCINQQHLKHRLLEIDKEINSKTMVSSLSKQIDKIKMMIQHELNREVIKKDDLAKIEEEIVSLKEKEKAIERLGAISAREQKYIKSRLVTALNHLNYEVVEDTEVIDFETSDTFLLKIPGQSNFLNLRLDDSGKMLYNFLIPENRDDLSHDDKLVKMLEMEETCHEFKSMLKDLQKQGLQIELKNEVNISEKALIRLPQPFLEKLHRSEKNKPSTKKNPGEALKMKK